MCALFFSILSWSNVGYTTFSIFKLFNFTFNIIFLNEFHISSNFYHHFSPLLPSLSHIFAVTIIKIVSLKKISVQFHNKRQVKHFFLFKNRWKLSGYDNNKCESIILFRIQINFLCMRFIWLNSFNFGNVADINLHCKAEQFPLLFVLCNKFEKRQPQLYVFIIRIYRRPQSTHQ